MAALLITIIRQPVLAVSGQQRIAYYGNWDIYGNNYFVKDIERSGAASQLTTLVYSFENINPTTLKCFQDIVPAEVQLLTLH
jgi:chitinase